MVVSSTEFSALSITEDELRWLKEACPYFKPSYLDHLAMYKFKPEQVSVQFTPTTEDAKWGNVEVEVTGPWHETVTWEVPLMACLNELYFQMVDTDWTGDGQYGNNSHQLTRTSCLI